MPMFHSPKGQPPGVLTKDKDRVLHYALTPEGTKQLRAAGLRSGDTVPARVLASLIRSGHAHSPRPAEAAGQVRFDFGEDNTADFLPRCELTGTSADLHLVVYGEGSGVVARLLAREPRFLLQKVTTLSIPVAALGAASLAILEAAEKLPRGSAAASSLREWWRQDWEAAWERLRQSRGSPTGRPTARGVLGYAPSLSRRRLRVNCTRSLYRVPCSKVFHRRR
jgi:hypothetical protein